MSSISSVNHFALLSSHTIAENDHSREGGVTEIALTTINPNVSVTTQQSRDNLKIISGEYEYSKQRNVVHRILTTIHVGTGHGDVLVYGGGSALCGLLLSAACITKFILNPIEWITLPLYLHFCFGTYFCVTHFITLPMFICCLWQSDKATKLEESSIKTNNSYRTWIRSEAIEELIEAMMSRYKNSKPNDEKNRLNLLVQDSYAKGLISRSGMEKIIKKIDNKNSLDQEINLFIYRFRSIENGIFYDREKLTKKNNGIAILYHDDYNKSREECEKTLLDRQHGRLLLVELLDIIDK